MDEKENVSPKGSPRSSSALHSEMERLRREKLRDEEQAPVLEEQMRHFCETKLVLTNQQAREMMMMKKRQHTNQKAT